MSIPTPLIIQGINERERCGCRPIAAGLALVKLRERYETWHTDSLPEDERTWPSFTAKHLRLAPGRADILLGRLTRMGGLLRCTRCQAESMSACACGAPYAPTHRWAPEPDASAFARATAAIEASPKKSNRALAKENSLSESTLRRAKRKLAEARVP